MGYSYSTGLVWYFLFPFSPYLDIYMRIQRGPGGMNFEFHEQPGDHNGRQEMPQMPFFFGRPGGQQQTVAASSSECPNSASRCPATVTMPMCQMRSPAMRPKERKEKVLGIGYFVWRATACPTKYPIPTIQFPPASGGPRPSPSTQPRICR